MPSPRMQRARSCDKMAPLRKRSTRAFPSSSAVGPARLVAGLLLTGSAQALVPNAVVSSNPTSYSFRGPPRPIAKSCVRPRGACAMGLSVPGEGETGDIESSDMYADMRRRLEVSIKWGGGRGGGVVMCLPVAFCFKHGVTARGGGRWGVKMGIVVPGLYVAVCCCFVLHHVCGNVSWWDSIVRRCSHPHARCGVLLFSFDHQFCNDVAVKV